ncbi:MAG: nitrilase-related carbon-nitrogen hydrolase [Gammaproteobacteria bacterium]
MSEMFYAAACQTDFPAPQTRKEIPARVDRMCEIVAQTVVGYEPFFDVRLLAFPEFAHAVPVYQSVAELRRKLAVPVPNEHTERYVSLARQFGCYIQTGSFLEADPDFPEHVFNTTVLIGPGGVLSKYRKVNPWIPWEVHASPHDIPDYPADPFPVVDTELGKIAVATCYDWLFPEVTRELAFRGAEIIVRISAYMDPWGASEPMDWWTLINRTRALENSVYVVAANQGASMAHYPPFSWPGASMVVDYDGRVLAQAEPGPGEKVVVAPIDVQRQRQERERRRGHDMRAHLRAGLYTYLQRPGLAPAGSGEIDGDSLEHRIDSAKRALRGA